MSTSEFAQKVYSMVSSGMRTESISMNFELAYQAKAASDRIRSAIRQIDEQVHSGNQLREVSVQLLDALDRLDSVERRFQTLSAGRSLATARPPE